MIQIGLEFVSYAHFTDNGSTPLTIAASMFFAMLFLSLILYTIAPTIAVHDTITADIESVIKSLFISNDSFTSVNGVFFTFVENMPANLSFLFKFCPTWINIISMIISSPVCHISHSFKIQKYICRQL